MRFDLQASGCGLPIQGFVSIINTLTCPFLLAGGCAGSMMKLEESSMRTEQWYTATLVRTYQKWWSGIGEIH
jgi:hypothetical protein